MGIKLIDKFLCISTIHPFIQPYLIASIEESHGNKGVQIKVTVLFNLPQEMPLHNSAMKVTEGRNLS